MHSPFIHAHTLGSKSRFRQLIDTQSVYTLPAKQPLWRLVYMWF